MMRRITVIFILSILCFGSSAIAQRQEVERNQHPVLRSINGEPATHYADGKLLIAGGAKGDVIQLMDMLGQRLALSQSNGSRDVIQIHLKSGVYLLRVGEKVVRLMVR